MQRDEEVVLYVHTPESAFQWPLRGLGQCNEALRELCERQIAGFNGLCAA
jgi:hypothetical protein